MTINESPSSERPPPDTPTFPTVYPYFVLASKLLEWGPHRNAFKRLRSLDVDVWLKRRSWPAARTKWPTKSCFWCARIRHASVQRRTRRGTGGAGPAVRLGRVAAARLFRRGTWWPRRTGLRTRARGTGACPLSSRAGAAPDTPAWFSKTWEVSERPDTRSLINRKSQDQPTRSQTYIEYTGGRTPPNKTHDENHGLEERANPRAGRDFWMTFQPNRGIPADRLAGWVWACFRCTRHGAGLADERAPRDSASALPPGKLPPPPQGRGRAHGRAQGPLRPPRSLPVGASP